MKLFSGSSSRPFWRTPPFASRDSGVLHQHGIQCVMRRDARGMMSTGWAIWGLAGLHRDQAWDFLTDGFKDWQPSAAPAEQRAFLDDVFERLTMSDPTYPSDIYRVPQELVLPAATIYRARCWTGMRLIGLARSSGDSAELAVLERRLRAALAGAHQAFLTPEAMSYLGLLS